MISTEHDPEFRENERDDSLSFSMMLLLIAVIITCVAYLILTSVFGKNISLLSLFYVCSSFAAIVCFPFELTYFCSLYKRLILKNKEIPYYDKYCFKKSVIIFTQLSLVLFFLTSSNVGNTQIGSAFEKKNYQESYYVFVENPSKSGQYNKYRADIICDTEAAFLSEQKYYIDCFYIKDNIRVCLDGVYGDELIPNQETIVTSSGSTDGSGLHIFLTTEKCN